MSSIIQATLENVDAQRKTAIKAAENAGYTVSEDMSIAALGQLFGETPEETSYKYWHRPKDWPEIRSIWESVRYTDKKDW